MMVPFIESPEGRLTVKEADVGAPDNEIIKRIWTLSPILFQKPS
jgi:hypothetical protein